MSLIIATIRSNNEDMETPDKKRIQTQWGEYGGSSPCEKKRLFNLDYITWPVAHLTVTYSDRLLFISLQPIRSPNVNFS